VFGTSLRGVSNVRMSIYMCIFKYMRTYACVCVHIYVHIRKRTRRRFGTSFRSQDQVPMISIKYINVYIHIYMHICVRVCIHTCIYMQIYVEAVWDIFACCLKDQYQVYSYMYICLDVHVQMYIYICVYIHIHANI